MPDLSLEHVAVRVLRMDPERPGVSRLMAEVIAHSFGLTQPRPGYFPQGVRMRLGHSKGGPR